MSELGWREDRAVSQFEIGGFKNFVYGVADWRSKKVAIVDPQSGLDEVWSGIDRLGLVLQAVWLTHTHWDHVAGLPEVLRRHPECEIVLHESDFHRIQKKLPAGTAVRFVRDGDQLALGGTSAQVIHTPGHSAGGVCFFFERESPPLLISGDTVFIRDCGRTDLETGDVSQMFDSLQRLKRLPREAVLLPGHHYAPEFESTLGDEFERSPPFLCQTVDALANLP